MPSIESTLFDSRVVLASAFSVILWEQAISFRDEIEAVWKSKRWSSTRVAFLLNRYFAILGMFLYLVWMYAPFPRGLCTAMHWLPYAISLISLLAGDYILGVRVYAVWERSLPIAIGLLSLMSITLGTDLWTLHGNYAMKLPVGENGCVSMPGSSVEKYTYVPWAICTFYELVALVLVLVRVFRYRGQGGGDAPVLDLIVRDGVYYFLAVFCAKLGATLNYRFNKNNPSLLVPVAAVVASIFCSRLFFRMSHQSREPSSINRSSRSWRSPYGTRYVMGTEDSATVKASLPPISEKIEEAELELFGRKNGDGINGIERR